MSWLFSKCCINAQGARRVSGVERVVPVMVLTGNEDHYRNNPLNTTRLPLLANIAPPHIRRVVLAQRMLQKTKDSPHLPVHMDIFNPPTARLPSRRPIWKNPPLADLTVVFLWSSTACVEFGSHVICWCWSPVLY